MREETETQNRVSTFYKKRYSGNGRLFHEHISKKMLPQYSYGKILDVGCGTGFMMRFNDNIYGIDISQGMLSHNPYKKRICQGRAERMPFQSGCFNHVICRGILHHLEGPEKGLCEIKRVLKTGGTVSFLETNASVLNTFPRKLLTYTGRFSRNHKNFKFLELKRLIEEYFDIEGVVFVGYVAYLLIGFPDFIDIPIPKKAALRLIRLDERISKSRYNNLAFNVLVQAKKQVS